MTLPSREWADLRPRLIVTTLLCAALVASALGASGDGFAGVDGRWWMTAGSVVVVGVGAWALGYLLRRERP